MRSFRIYFGTMIIIFVLAAFVYGMSFVYTKSVETTTRTDVSVMSVSSDEQLTTFSLFNNDISLNKSQIYQTFSAIGEKMPCEYRIVVDLFGVLGAQLEEVYYKYF